jgi:hypothetical protein
MLDKDTASDFDKRRKELLKKYFGQFGLEVKDAKGKPKPYAPKPSKEEIDANSLYWNDLPSGTFDCSNSNNKYEGQIYAVPIQKNGDKELLIIHALQKVNINGKVYYLVKFIFNKDEKMLDPLINIPEYSGFTITKKFGGRFTNINKVYYGLIEKLPKNGDDFEIYYSEVTNANDYTDPEKFSFRCENKTAQGVVITVSNLFSADATKSQKAVSTDFSKKIFSEKDKHSDNLDKLKNGKKLLDALKEKVPTP